MMNNALIRQLSQPDRTKTSSVSPTEFRRALKHLCLMGLFLGRRNPLAAFIGTPHRTGSTDSDYRL
jgi:hypothetical protein